MDEKPEGITLFRGIPAEQFPEIRNLFFVDDMIEYIFHSYYPHLLSPVANRYTIDEAHRRYRNLKNPEQIFTLMEEHYKGEREFSIFVSTAEREDEAAYFAGSSLGNKAWGLIVRFQHKGPYERFYPRYTLHDYTEVFIVGGVEPSTIDKITLIGAGFNDPFTIHRIYRRYEGETIEKFYSSRPDKFHYLRDVIWSPESYFTPPI